MDSKEEISPIYASIIAALYTAITLAIGFIAYGPIQFRLSDAMLVLPFHRKFGKSAVVGLAIGGFLGNLASPYLPWDLIVGFTLNLVVGSIMYVAGRFAENKFRENRVARLFIAVVAAVIGSIIIGFVVALMIVFMEIKIFDTIVWLSIALSVFVGEVVSFVIGGAILLNALEGALPSTA